MTMDLHPTYNEFNHNELMHKGSTFKPEAPFCTQITRFYVIACNIVECAGNLRDRCGIWCAIACKLNEIACNNVKTGDLGTKRSFGLKCGTFVHELVVHACNLNEIACNHVKKGCLVKKELLA